MYVRLAQSISDGGIFTAYGVVGAVAWVVESGDRQVPVQVERLVEHLVEGDASFGVIAGTLRGALTSSGGSIALVAVTSAPETVQYIIIGGCALTINGTRHAVPPPATHLTGTNHTHGYTTELTLTTTDTPRNCYTEHEPDERFTHSTGAGHSTLTLQI